MDKKLVALVGRPNVGKSTLFNRLSIRKRAIVHDLPGVTRDRKYADAKIGPMLFRIVDTPGLEESEEGKLEHRMMQQTMQAIMEADLVCLIVDNISGITPADKFFANFIRKYAKNYIVIANKSEKRFVHDKEFYTLGFGDPVPISAEHGQGLADLYDAIAAKIDTEDVVAISNPETSD
jgi:GTP-binding protein